MFTGLVGGMRRIKWEVTARTSAGGVTAGVTGDTSNIDSAFRVGEWQVFPFPEVGAEVAVGYRSLIDVSLKVLGAYVDYFNYHGDWVRIEAKATLYPIKYVGIQLGYQFTTYDFNSITNSSTKKFSFNLDYSGVTFALIFRI